MFYETRITAMAALVAGALLVTSGAALADPARELSGTDLGSGRISGTDLGSGRIANGDLGSGRVRAAAKRIGAD